MELSLAGPDAILRRALEQQNQIGWDRFVLGFIAEDFQHAATQRLPRSPRRRRRRRNPCHRHQPTAEQQQHLVPSEPEDTDPLQSTAQPKQRRDRHPLNWGGKLITLLWSFFEEHWDTRNSDLHGNSPQETATIRRHKLIEEVERLY